MKKKILEDWLKALRSGKYQNARGALRNDSGFCALGVLCDISDLGSWESQVNSTKMVYLKQDKYLPSEVASWAGMTQGEVGAVTSYLLVYNDQIKLSLSDLADLLEEKYKKTTNRRK